MSLEFTPKTELERIFAQALFLDENTLRRRIARELQASQLPAWAAHSVALAYFHAARGNGVGAREVTESLIELCDRLDEQERLSLARVCHHAIALLREGDPDLRIQNLTFYSIVSVPLTLLSMTDRKLDIFEMWSLIKRTYGREIAASEMQSLKEKYRCNYQRLEPTRELLESNNPQHRVGRPHSQSPAAEIACLPPKIAVLSNLHQKLSEETVIYGARSSQVGGTLVALINHHLTELQNLDIETYLKELKEICNDPKVVLSAFQLRSLYALAGQVHDLSKLLNVIEEIERSLFQRRNATIGYDINSGAALLRLIRLWRSTDTLEQGELFCENLKNTLAEKLQNDEFLVRQLSSIIAEIARLKNLPAPEKSIILETESYNHCDEYMLSMTVTAFEHWSNARCADAFAALEEMLSFYGECTGDATRRVGEMLWLLTETPLFAEKRLLDSLINRSKSAARDRYLNARFMQHVRRVSPTESSTFPETAYWSAVTLFAKWYSPFANILPFVMHRSKYDVRSLEQHGLISYLNEASARDEENFELVKDAALCAQNGHLFDSLEKLSRAFASV